MITYIDLFCGIGGFRIAAEQVLSKRGLPHRCVFSCDIDSEAQTAYEANFGEKPEGDITLIDAADVPGHDILFAGFPCQPFSIIGDMKGFEDTRGTLFFDIARILEAKRPRAFILENVKMLVGHRRGRTISRSSSWLRRRSTTGASPTTAGCRSCPSPSPSSRGTTRRWSGRAPPSGWALPTATW